LFVRGLEILDLSMPLRDELEAFPDKSNCNEGFLGGFRGRDVFECAEAGDEKIGEDDIFRWWKESRGVDRRFIGVDGTLAGIAGNWMGALRGSASPSMYSADSGTPTISCSGSGFLLNSIGR
jgi:hypothetical protein